MFAQVGESELGKTLNSKTDTGDLCPYLCAVNVLQGSFDLSTIKECKIEEKDKRRYLLKKGDLLICEGGDAGRCAIWEDGREMFYQNALHRVKAKDNAYNYFLMYYLQYLKKNGTIDKLSKGVTIKHFSKTALSSLIVSLPSFSEQLTIAEELDSIQSMIGKCREQLEDYDRLARSIFHEMFGDPVRNEKGWEMKKLKDLSKIGTGGTPSRKLSDRYYNGKIAWVKTTEVCNNYIFGTEERITEEAISESNCNIYGINTVILAMYGQGKTRGQSAILKIPAATNQACAAIQCYDNLCHTYLFWFLQMTYSHNRELGNGVNQKNMNLSIVGNLIIPLPPLPLQQQFATRIEAIEEMKEATKAQLADLQQLFDSRMQYYFS